MSDRTADLPDRAADRSFNLAADVPDRAADRSPSGAQRGPPEGGYGWAVCLAAMWTNGTIFGLLNTSGVLFVALLEAFPGSDAFQTGWIYDYTGSYNAAFFYAGAPPIVGTCILFLVSLGRFSAGEGGEKQNDAANVPDEEKALAADTKAPPADPSRKSVGTQCTDLDREFALDAGSVMHIYNTEEDMILIYDKVSSV